MTQVKQRQILHLYLYPMKQLTQNRPNHSHKQNVQNKRTICLDAQESFNGDCKNNPGKKIKIDQPNSPMMDIDCKILQAQTAKRQKSESHLPSQRAKANPKYQREFHLLKERQLQKVYSPEEVHRQFYVSSKANKSTIYAKLFSLEREILLKSNYNSFLVDEVALKLNLTKKATSLYFQFKGAFKFETFKDWVDTQETFKGLKMQMYAQLRQKRSYRLLVISSLRALITKLVMFMENDRQEDYFKIERQKEIDKMLKHVTSSQRWFEQRACPVFSRLAQSVFLAEVGMSFRGEELKYLYDQLQEVVNKNGCRKLGYISKLLRTAETMSYKQFAENGVQRWPNFYIPMKHVEWFSWGQAGPKFSRDFDVELAKAFVRRGLLRTTMRFVAQQMTAKKYDEECLILLRRENLINHLKTILQQAIHFAQYELKVYFHQRHSIFSTYPVEQPPQSDTNSLSQSNNNAKVMISSDFMKFLALSSEETARLVQEETETSCQRMILDYYLSNAFIPKKQLEVKELIDRKNMPFLDNLIRDNGKLSYVSEKDWKYPFEYLKQCVQAVLETIKWSNCKKTYSYSMAPIQGSSEDNENFHEVDYETSGIQQWIVQNQLHFDNIFYLQLQQKKPTQEQILEHNEQIIRQATEIVPKKRKRQKNPKISKINQFINYFAQPKPPNSNSQNYSHNQLVIFDDSDGEIVEVQCPQNDLRYLYNRVQRKEAQKQDLYRQLQLSERQICRLNSQSQNQIFMRQQAQNMSLKHGALDLDQDKKISHKAPTRQRYKYNAINRKGRFLETYEQFTRQNKVQLSSLRCINPRGKMEVKNQQYNNPNAVSVDDDDLQKAERPLKMAKSDMNGQSESKGITIELDAGRRVYPGILDQGMFVKSQGHEKYLYVRDKVLNKHYHQKPVPIQSGWQDQLVDDRIQAYENKDLFK